MNFNMQNLMRQAQDMQKKMKNAQDELEKTTFEGNASGMVSVVMNGKYEILDLKIDAKCVDPDDTEMLEDLVKVAFADAIKKVNEASKNAMGGLPNGMGNMF